MTAHSFSTQYNTEQF